MNLNKVHSATVACVTIYCVTTEECVRPAIEWLKLQMLWKTTVELRRQQFSSLLFLTTRVFSPIRLWVSAWFLFPTVKSGAPQGSTVATNLPLMVMNGLIIVCPPRCGPCVTIRGQDLSSHLRVLPVNMTQAIIKFPAQSPFDSRGGIYAHVLIQQRGKKHNNRHIIYLLQKTGHTDADDDEAPKTLTFSVDRVLCVVPVGGPLVLCTDTHLETLNRHFDVD
ncbi:hypothetical protein F2P81_007494 [Scophthalmus maximus]|uniref:Uncharacterized protein n=1 Tax=Scophthalmus maximus TaxID=52904 RepID=A0A6A4T2V5_SCOMX|nr:hypothetical protein F2P81_007494 [Scophthalmus maximus]